jgi:thiol-disulfide isomerase/thioredoxin
MRWMISGLMFLAATVGLVACAPTATNSATGLATGTVGPDGLVAGDLVPEVRLMHYQTGQAMTLSSLRGKPVLLNFWATWCPPCRAEIPKLNELAQKYPKLTIIGVDVAEDRDTISTYLKQQSTAYDIWHENKVGGLVTDNTAKLLNAWEGRDSGYSIPFENSVAALFAN